MAASTVPADVRKSFAVKGSPLIDHRYSLTSSEQIIAILPFESVYSKRRCPGRSWHLDTIFARRQSETATFCFFSAFAAKFKSHRRTLYLGMLILHRRQTKTTDWPENTPRFPIRISEISSSLTTVASTFSRHRPGSFRSSASQLRIFGRLRAINMTLSYWL
jgi:hypothetical protein